MRRKLLLLVFTFCSIICYGSADSLYNAICAPISLRKDIAWRTGLCMQGIRQVDDLMTVNEYYEAQRWLNKVIELYHHNQASNVNFYISSRQTEVYYYENLFQLGLEEALHALDVGRQLKDSFFMADACNFTGLHLLNINRLKEAEGYFEKALGYYPSREAPAHYLPLSQLYHIYGNLGEVFEKRGNVAIARQYYALSFREAKKVSATRGMAVASSLVGKMLLLESKPDSAVKYFTLSNTLLPDTPEHDIYLVTQAYQARASSVLGNRPAAQAFLKEGLRFMKHHPEINTLYSIEFLKNAVSAYKALQDREGTLRAYEELMNYDSARNARNYSQVQHILQSNMNYENRLLKMEVNESRHRQQIIAWRLYIAVAVILLLLTALLAYRYYFMQKIKLASMRNTISRDLHDDVGATLSSIHIFGSVVERAIDKEPEKARSAIRNITASSRELVDKMGDIVWAIDNSTSHEKALSYKIKNFFYDLMNAEGISCTYRIDEHLEQKLTNPQVRKNILLIAKEALNNIVKYSGATDASISLSQYGKDIFSCYSR